VNLGQISRAETCCSLGYWCIQLFWPRVVVRKWLNISSKDSDYSADSEDDYASSDSASDTNGNAKLPNSLNVRKNYGVFFVLVFEGILLVTWCRVCSMPERIAIWR